MQPIINMQPLQPAQQPPVPLRWSEAVRNVEAAQSTLDELIKQLDGALYLDDEAWQQAVPHAKFSAALHGQQRKIQELEQQLAAVLRRLEESERGRRAAEDRAAQLTAELEGNASVFKLHYDELLRRDEEIHDLQAVISALSLGSTRGSGGGGGGGGGGGDRAGSRGGGVGGTGRSSGAAGGGISSGDDMSDGGSIL